MQTFLPYENFFKSADTLDKRRCWKQVVEAYQIINILDGKSKSWINHPAVRMWKGFREALVLYYNTFHYVSVNKWKIKVKKLQQIESNEKELIVPSWIGLTEFHSKHRATLLYKNFDYYSQFKWSELPAYEYFWPVDKDGKLHAFK